MTICLFWGGRAFPLIGQSPTLITEDLPPDQVPQLEEVGKPQVPHRADAEA